MPALVEADDGGQYVVKLRGAGQGPLALAAELIVGELARALGLRMPELVFVEFDPLFGRNEPDPEIRQLMRDSSGTNIGLRFLAGAVTFDPAVQDHVDAMEASLIVWLDAFVANVDRTPRNPNLLLADKELWLIDHGAALYYHHDWPTMLEKASAPPAFIRDHVLLRWATEVSAAAAAARAKITLSLLDGIVAQAPDMWLDRDAPGAAAARRDDYREFFRRRMEYASIIEEEIERGRAGTV